LEVAERRKSQTEQHVEGSGGQETERECFHEAERGEAF
jgi:hypothetical protein